MAKKNKKDDEPGELVGDFGRFPFLADDQIDDSPRGQIDRAAATAYDVGIQRDENPWKEGDERRDWWFASWDLQKGLTEALAKVRALPDNEGA